MDLKIFNYIEQHIRVLNTRLHDDEDVIRSKVAHLKLESCSNYLSYRIIIIWNSVPQNILNIERIYSPSGSSCLFKKHFKG